MADVPHAHGLRSAATRFAAHALALVRSRLELAAVELALEREQIQIRLALVFAGILLILFAALGVGTFVVIHFWETSRTAAILGVSALFAGAGAFLLYYAREMGREAPTPFAGTLSELEKDRAAITGRDAEA